MVTLLLILALIVVVVIAIGTVAAILTVVGPIAIAFIVFPLMDIIIITGLIKLIFKRRK